MEVYESCGQDWGTEIWRIENFELVEVPKQFYGKFYTGDSYVILHTYEKINEATGECEKAQNLHFWIGDESSQDEYGAAAIIVTQMDTVAGDLPVQFRETENRESAEFMDYFKKVEYLQGGVASGFSHVEINEDDNKRLLRVKGKGAKVFSKEVAFSWDSFTTDDVYIVEIGSDMWRWKGAKSSMFEWLESDAVSREIRDNEQAGRGEIHEVEEVTGFTPQPMKDALGGDPPASFPETGAQKKAAEESHGFNPTLYKVSTDSGELETTEVGSGTGMSCEILETDDCYILDVGSNIFVWKGKTSSGQERNAAMKSAVTFLKQGGREKGCSIQVFPQGSEAALFKQAFQEWNIGC